MKKEISVDQKLDLLSKGYIGMHLMNNQLVKYCNAVTSSFLLLFILSDLTTSRTQE
uniref:Uncharacterized protein n=1 Tax=Rhizophora mucronata TaxID=61149 RepID=A0A2P2PCT1_RHIMU